MEPIALTDVRKRYGPADALDGVTVTFEPGSVHAVVGPNGSGKSTLFRVLLGLTRPDSGAVSLPDGTVGCSFQTPRVYPDLTVGENLTLFADLVGASEEWVDTLIEACGLSRMLHRRAGALSAGFGKRLDIAIALIDRPDVVLLDEPVADVDDEYRAHIRSLLAEYATPERILVVATHRLAELESMMDTVTVLNAGRVVTHGPLESVADSLPAHYTESRGGWEE